jgi:molybdate transport system substrate-binding protein
MRRRGATLLLGLSLMAGLSPQPALAGEIKVFCTQALRTSLQELGPRFEKATGHTVVIEVAPSGQLVKRLANGEPADLIIANADNIDALIKADKVSGPRIDIARAQVGLSIKAGTPKPDISTPDAVKRALLDAKAVAYSAGGLSGNAFENVLAKLGIADEIKAKAKNGSPAAGFVARGEADIAVQQISELIAVEGAELVGPLPAELDQVTQFSMGTVARNNAPDIAKAMLTYLQSPEAQAVIKSKGLTPG